MMWFEVKRSLEVIAFLILSFTFLVVFVFPICLGLLLGDLGMQIWVVLSNKKGGDKDGN